MKLSIIIVNYNVRHFLEQALLSVQRAAQSIETEIFVVDNNSTDTSIEMLQTHFPFLKLIQNKINKGFAVANNQAYSFCTGDYILLLNPDTVISEDTFEKCIAKMDSDSRIGGLGVKAVDGSGFFLPESKRGFPTPWVAFCKAFGLSTFFPKSKLFNHYYLGFLPTDESNEVEILVGSFMFLRRAAIEKMKVLLDESYFMYGEDIDLSYRILKAGYKNYYLADTTIIHYKGESTKKGSLNYVRTFYNAMLIFARKNLPRSNAWLYIALIQMAVWFRALITVLSYFFKTHFLPLLDSILIIIGLFYLRSVWTNFYFSDSSYIKPHIFLVNSIIYTVIWLSSVFFSGGYDNPIAMRRVLRGIVIGTILNASVYGLLNLSYRSSRMILLLGGIWAFLATVFVRWLASVFNKNILFNETKSDRKLVVVGDNEETERAQKIWLKKNPNGFSLGFVSINDFSFKKDALGNISALKEIVKLYKPDDLIFCAATLPYQSIIKNFEQLQSHKINLSILNPESEILIGSTDKNARADFDERQNYKIATRAARRNKRLLDVLLTLSIFIFSPILFFIGFKRARFFVSSAWEVLKNKKTWAGYIGDATTDLPFLKSSIFPNAHLNLKIDSLPYESTKSKLNVLYAKNYSIQADLSVFFQALKKFGS